MVNNCCVRGCHNIQDREKDRRYYCVPQVARMKGATMLELTSRRRREWIAQLRLKSLTFESKTIRHVCSDHFLNEAPAYVGDVNNPSWLPTLKLGHEEGQTCSNDRFSRLFKRKARLQTTVTSGKDLSTCVQADERVNESEDSSLVSEICVPPPDSDEYGTYCQTDPNPNQSKMTIEEERLLRDELNRLTQENVELKIKIGKKNMTQESLQEQDDTIKYFTGLQNYVTLAAVFNLIVGCLLKDKRRALEPFQAFLLTMMHIRVHTPLQHLAYIFCVSRATAYKCFGETIHAMYYCLRSLVFWPENSVIKAALPMQFQIYPWNQTVSIIDCFEIFIDRPSSSDASALTWSHYKGNNTIKYLISVTPGGHISFISKGWGGRVSDKTITRESGYLTFLKTNDLVPADRGFDISDLVGMCGAQIKIPSFTRGKSQLSAQEVESTRTLAHLRIHVERVIGVLSGKFSILSDVIPIEMLHTRGDEDITCLDKIVTVACALVNICDGIV